MPAEPLTAEESATLAEAILELAEAGEHDAAEALGKLAAEPEELRKVLAGQSDTPDAATPAGGAS